MEPGLARDSMCGNKRLCFFMLRAPHHPLTIQAFEVGLWGTHSRPGSRPPGAGVTHFEFFTLDCTSENEVVGLGWGGGFPCAPTQQQGGGAGTECSSSPPLPLSSPHSPVFLLFTVFFPECV